MLVIIVIGLLADKILVLALGTLSPPALGYGQSLNETLLRDRQGDREDRAFARAFASGADRAAMHFDNRLADG